MILAGKAGSEQPANVPLSAGLLCSRINSKGARGRERREARTGERAQQKEIVYKPRIEERGKKTGGKIASTGGSKDWK